MEIVVQPQNAELVETPQARVMRFQDGPNVISIVMPTEQWDKFKAGLTTGGKLQPANMADLAGLPNMATGIKGRR